eukprot:g4262.t1
MGMEPSIAILLFLAAGGGAAIGGAIGGYIGDYAHKKNNKYGRIFTAQVSVFLGLPISAIIFLAIPREVSAGWLYGIVSLALGLSISWPPPNTNSMISDVFDQRDLALAMGNCFFIEGSVSAWSSAVVGGFATSVFNVQYIECYQYQTQATQDELLKGIAYSVLVVCEFMWFFCLLCYCPLYFSYWKESKSMSFSEDGKKKSEKTTEMVEVDDVNVGV